jgi:GNAT superfamily N-acetyltransferase
MLDEVLEVEADRGQDEIVLECFESNHPAIELYKSRGFEVGQRLYGYAGAGPAPEEGAARALAAVDATEVAAAMTAHGGAGLSWQTSGPALVHLGPHELAFRLGPARAIVSLPDEERRVLRALVVNTGKRGQGHGARMLAALAARFPDRGWKMLQVCPEAVGVGFFERLGFERESLNQVEMRCPLYGRRS